MAGAYCNAMHKNDLECTVAMTRNVGRPDPTCLIGHWWICANPTKQIRGELITGK